MRPAGLGLVALAACSSAPEAGLRFAPDRIVSSETSNGATPMFLVSPVGTRVLSWVAEPDSGQPARLFVATSDGEGRAARTGSLGDPLGGIAPHGEAPPQLAAGSDGALFTLYIVGREVPGRRFPASALRFARSDDGGVSWSDPISVNEGDAFGSHNFHSLLARGDAVYAAWLASKEGTSGVWLRRSRDGGRTWEASRPVHLEATCPCCRTALALGSDGTLYAAWRKVFAGDIRDIVVARSVDGGATWDAPVKPRDDGWVYPGCPHAGPSLRVSQDGAVHVAWWTGRQGAAGVYYAGSTDGGRTFTAEPIATAERSAPAHVQLALADSAVVVVWDDGHHELPGILLRVSRDGGASFGKPVRLSSPGRPASFPVIGVWGDSLLVAWTQVTEEAMRLELAARARMNSPGAAMPLPRVGQSEIFARVGELRRGREK